ncbi:hypothetical protein GCM10029992_63760 [Glycomyces albus]
MWEKCFVGEDLYAIPIDTHALVNYYNRTICDQAGVLNPDGTLLETHGVEEYFDLLRAVKDVTGEYGTSLDTWAGWRQFWAWYRQQDGEWIFHDDGYELDDEKALTAIDVIYRMAEEGLCPQVSDGAQTAANFENGVGGLVQVGNWEIVRFRAFDEAQGLDFSITEMPDFFGNRRTQGDSHAYILPHHNSWDSDVRRATIDYAAWMLKHSFEWGAGGGHTGLPPGHRERGVPVARAQRRVLRRGRERPIRPRSLVLRLRRAPLHRGQRGPSTGVFAGADPGTGARTHERARRRTGRTAQPG